MKTFFRKPTTEYLTWFSLEHHRGSHLDIHSNLSTNLFATQIAPVAIPSGALYVSTVIGLSLVKSERGEKNNPQTSRQLWSKGFLRTPPGYREF